VDKQKLYIYVFISAEKINQFDAQSMACILKENSKKIFERGKV
jgi:hypothetical protein